MEVYIQTFLVQARRLLAALMTPGMLYQVLVVAIALLCAWLVFRRMRDYLHGEDKAHPFVGARRFTLHTVKRIVVPLSMLAMVLIGRGLLIGMGFKTTLLDVVVPLVLSLAAVRLLVYALRKGFRMTPALKAWENIIVAAVWVVVALHLTGWLPAVEESLDALAFKMGNSRISLLATIKLVALIALLLTLAFWISGVLDRRMRRMPHMTPSLQVAFGKISKTILIALAFFVAIDAAGIDLTTLAVFGGALGVGIGFGLQRITSNFISGFILVLDRSIKPGDVISVGGDDTRYGWVQELRARYVVVRGRDGVERLIPNENLITSEVINWSYSDRNTRVRIPVQISYDDDPEQAMALLLEAVKASPRILAVPEPAARLMGFYDNGIQLELRIWISDPENGIGNVRTAVNVAIWKRFKAAGITMPYPQRDVHLKATPIAAQD